VIIHAMSYLGKDLRASPTLSRIMISLLRGILMLGDLPNPRLAGYIFLEMIALGFALEAVAALMRGADWWKWTAALIMGVVFMVVGVKSSQIVESTPNI